MMMMLASNSDANAASAFASSFSSSNASGGAGASGASGAGAAAIAALEKLLVDYDEASSIVASRLKSVERRLDTLIEDTFFPLMRETDAAVRAKRNCEETGKCMDEIIEQFAALDGAMASIRSSEKEIAASSDASSNSSKTRLRFVSQMDILLNALKFLRSNGDFASSKHALAKGAVCLQEAHLLTLNDFEHLLRMHGPAKAQYLIMKKWRSKEDLLTSGIGAQLRAIGESIIKVGGIDACARAYAAARGPVAADVIRRAGADIMPFEKKRRESALKKNRKKKQSMSPAKAAFQHPHSKYPLTPIMSSHTRRRDSVHDGTDALLEIALHVLETERMLAEATLTSRSCSHRVYLAAMAEPCAVLEQIMRNVLPSDGAQHIFAAETHFEVLEIVRALRRALPNFRRCLMERGGGASEDVSPPSSALACINSIEIEWGAKARMWYSSILKEIETDTSKVPKSATVLQLSSNALNYLRRIVKYGDTAAFLCLPHETVVDHLRRDGDRRASSVHAQADAAFSNYIHTAVALLQDVLDEKVDQAKSISAAGLSLFRLNNLDYIRSRIAADEGLTSVFGAERLDKMTALVREAQNQCIDEMCGSARRALDDLLSLQSQSARECFAALGKWVEAIKRTTKRFVVPNKSLRKDIREGIKRCIEERYARAHGMIGTLNFSKRDAAKFLKMTPKVVEELIATLFEETA